MSVTKDEFLNGGVQRPMYAPPPIAHEMESDPTDNMPNAGGSAVGAGVQVAEAGKGNSAVQPAKPVDGVQPPVEKTVDNSPKKMSYKEMYQALNPYKPPTAEELEAQRKKEKRQKIFAALGDGISALANLYFTTQGAPNMYNPANSQQDVVKDRWDKIKQERDQHMKEYTEALMKAQALDDENADNERKWQRLLQIDKVNADKAKAEQERKDAIAEAQRLKYEAAANKDDKLATLYQQKSEAIAAGLPYVATKLQAEIDKLKASAGKDNRQGTSSWVSSKGGKSGGTSSNSDGRSGGKPYGTFNGVEYKTKSDYDRAVVRYAKDNNIPLTYNKKSTDKWGKVSTTQANRTIAGLAAEGEKHYASHASKPTPKPKPAANPKPPTKPKPVVKPKPKHAGGGGKKKSTGGAFD